MPGMILISSAASRPVDRDILDHVLIQRLAGLSGIDRDDDVRARDNFNFLLCGLDLENDRRQAQSGALRQRDACVLQKSARPGAVTVTV